MELSRTAVPSPVRECNNGSSSQNITEGHTSTPPAHPMERKNGTGTLGASAIPAQFTLRRDAKAMRQTQGCHKEPPQQPAQFQQQQGLQAPGFHQLPQFPLLLPFPPGLQVPLPALPLPILPLPMLPLPVLPFPQPVLPSQAAQAPQGFPAMQQELPQSAQQIQQASLVLPPGVGEKSTGALAPQEPAPPAQSTAGYGALRGELSGSPRDGQRPVFHPPIAALEAKLKRARERLMRKSQQRFNHLSCLKENEDLKRAIEEAHRDKARSFQSAQQAALLAQQLKGERDELQKTLVALQKRIDAIELRAQRTEQNWRSSQKKVANLYRENWSLKLQLRRYDP